MLLEEGVRFSYGLLGPRENPMVESFFGRFKGENRDFLMESRALLEPREGIRGRVEYDTAKRLPPGLGYRTPLEAMGGLLAGARRDSPDGITGLPGGGGGPQAADPLLGWPSRAEQGQPVASPPREDLKEESALDGSRQNEGECAQK